MKEKEGSQFTHPLERGWLLPYLLALDRIFYGRWDYWLRTLDAGKPLDEPIPQITFDSHYRNEATKNLRDCIKIIQASGHGAHEAWCAFIDWLLWGFGSDLIPEFPPRINESASWRLYTTFNLGLIMQEPGDYMAWGSCELGGMAKGNGNGYFPTPMNVCMMMAQMQMTSADKSKTVADPCVGTGSMLLAASNFSLRLYAQDISLNMVKMCTVNGYIFMPWLIAPGDGIIDWNTVDDYKTVIAAIEKIKGVMTIPLLSYTPKTNTLADWV